MPPEVLKDPKKKAMCQAVLDYAMEWDEGSSWRGISGVECTALRKTEHRDCIIEGVDQLRFEIKLYDRVDRDVFVRPLWQLVKFGDLDYTYVTLYMLILYLVNWGSCTGTD